MQSTVRKHYAHTIKCGFLSLLIVRPCFIPGYKPNDKINSTPWHCGRSAISNLLCTEVCGFLPRGPASKRVSGIQGHNWDESGSVLLKRRIKKEGTRCDQDEYESAPFERHIKKQRGLSVRNSLSFECFHLNFFISNSISFDSFSFEGHVKKQRGTSVRNSFAWWTSPLTSWPDWFNFYT